MTELETVKEILNNHNYSCVISNGESIVYTSFEKGVKPLLDFYNKQENKNSIFIADKVIGKGAAFLVVLMSAKGLYTPTISESALELLNKYKIKTKYEKIVPYIKNRTGDGRCPIETAVISEEDPNVAYNKIITKIKELQGNRD